MARHLLTDRHVRNAKPKASAYRLADGDGLYLFVPPSGVRAWQFRYRFGGKPQTSTLGRSDVLTLADARKAADEARKKLVSGAHLTVAKRVEKAKRRASFENTFASVAADWMQREAKRMKWSESYREEVAASLRNHLYELDALPLAEVTAPVTAPMLRKIERTAPHMTEKVRRRLRAILDHGVEHGVIIGNPLPATRRGAKVQRRHFPAVLERDALGEILRAADATDASRGVKRGHMLLAFCAQRVSEVVGAQWSEFDFDHATWAIPRHRMKRKDPERGPHLIPIPTALLDQMREWHRADGSDAIYVCPAPRDKARPVTAEAIEKFYRSALCLGGKHSPHSWRSSFSTIARDAGKDADTIEAQLDHVVGSKVAAAYDRAHRLDLRRELMTWYESVLVAARDGAKVHELRDKRA